MSDTITYELTVTPKAGYWYPINGGRYTPHATITMPDGTTYEGAVVIEYKDRE